MTTFNLAVGTSGSELGLALAASTPPATEDVRELKTCERCGVQFTRSLLSRERDCRRCVAKTKEREEREKAEEAAWREKRVAHEQAQRAAMELNATKRERAGEKMVKGQPFRVYMRERARAQRGTVRTATLTRGAQ